jgi:hypothetical protein
MTSKAIPDCKTVVRHDIEANSQVDMTYVAMNSLATVDPLQEVEAWFTALPSC